MYVVAERMLCGYQPHWFETFAQFQEWAEQNPRHGPIVAQGLATMSGETVLPEIDHRPARQKQDTNQTRGDEHGRQT